MWCRTHKSIQPASNVIDAVELGTLFKSVSIVPVATSIACVASSRARSINQSGNSSTNRESITRDCQHPRFGNLQQSIKTRRIRTKYEPNVFLLSAEAFLCSLITAVNDMLAIEPMAVFVCRFPQKLKMIENRY